jgi:hypothetical protein
MQKITSFLFLISLILFSCTENSSSKLFAQRINTSSNYFDTSIYTILLYDSIDFEIFEDGKAPDLSQNDLIRIDQVLIKAVKEYNKKQEIKFKELNLKNPELSFKKEDFVIELRTYKRQYVPITNKFGEKEVWVNCFCSPSDSRWKTEIILVNDGGNCFFNLKINIKKKRFYDFWVNGNA